MKQKKKLREIAIIAAGQGAPQGENNYCEDGIPFIKAGNLIELLSGKRECEVQKVSESVAKKHRLKLYPAGTVLFAKSGMSCMKGYVYQLKTPCYVVSHLACITAMGISGEYLKFYFEFHRPNLLVKDEAYPSISLSDIGEMQISFGSDAEQQAAVANLNKISKIIELCRIELKKIDDLVKSQFIEMFGDSEYNTKNLPVCKLGDLCNVGSSKRIYQEELTTSGISFLRISDLNAKIDDIESQPNLFISEELYASLKTDGFVPSAGDILVTARGTLGRCYIVKDSDKFYFQDGMITLLSEIDERISNIYLVHLFNSNGIRKQIARIQAGSTVAYLSIAMAKKLDIMLPPLELQNQFAAFVEQTDKSKVLIREHLFSIYRLRKVEKTQEMCYNIFCKEVV